MYKSRNLGQYFINLTYMRVTKPLLQHFSDFLNVSDQSKLGLASKIICNFSLGLEIVVFDLYKFLGSPAKEIKNP